MRGLVVQSCLSMTNAAPRTTSWWLIRGTPMAPYVDIGKMIELKR
jgi:hypothetical protein